MIKVLESISKIEEKLNNDLHEGHINDFRIRMSSNGLIHVYIIGKNIDDINDENVVVEYITEDNDNMELKEIYFNDDNDAKVNITDSQRRLSNLLNPNRKLNTDVPVITFYSYKGGVGRSTSLASCATHLSRKEKKKVVILDCDLEAPGFMNFFIEDPTSPIYKNGIVELFMDYECTDDISLSNYYWEASKKFSGDGEVYIFPAGNLDNQEEINGIYNTHISHYLLGLSNIDISSKDALYEKFEKLIADIITQINPDVILIDSKTGFNDIFGVVALRLSNIVIGFFGNSVQSKPGLYFFLDQIQKENPPELILVNSIIPADNRRLWFTSFSEEVNTYLAQISEDDLVSNDAVMGSKIVKMFPVTYNSILANIGTKFEDSLDYIDMIDSSTSLDYNSLFNYIGESINEYSNNRVGVQSDTPHIINMPSKSEDFALTIKRRILDTTSKEMPKLYAEETISFKAEYESGRYFFRKCMEDLFNVNKFIILGNKGTGKSYIYRSLKEDSIIKELKQRANKTNNNYQFIHIVDKDNSFETIKFDNYTNLNDLFFERFWTVYIWAVLMSKDIGVQSKLSQFEISDDTTTAVKFKEIVENDQAMVIVENDLREYNKKLGENNNTQLIIIFDELDKVVVPIKWSERISPLINLCKKMNYSNISPKLFLRSDLYKKLTNINNKNELENRTLHIEWDVNEIFAYFFKMIFSHSKDDFIKFLKEHNKVPNNFINKKIDKEFKNYANQPPIDEYTLKFLCSAFFGKYADVNNTPQYGESYEWFYLNLKNADDTISLRPFIDLLSISINNAKEDTSNYPILPQMYYTHGAARSQAVERHFKDLANDSGNGDLNIVFDYIRDRASYKLKYVALSQREMYQLLDEIITLGHRMDNKDRDSIIQLMLDCGIISKHFVRVGANVYNNYKFAFLYKYYLGLKTRKRRSRSNVFR